MRKIHISIVAADFHKEISGAMVESAEKAAEECGAVIDTVVHVPGCFEIPLAVKRLISGKTVDAIVVLGYIEKGETLHGEIIGHVAHHALMQLQLEHMKPIGFGIIGPGATEKQARVRMKGASQAAVQAALSQL